MNQSTGVEQYCLHCAAPLRLTARFCGKCGVELGSTASKLSGDLPGGRLVVVAALVVFLLGGVGAYAKLHPGVAPFGPGQSVPQDLPATTLLPSVQDSTLIPTPPPTSSEDDAVLAAVQGHWDAVREHRFEDAYAYLGPDIGIDESQWLTSHESDGISEVRYQFSVRDVGLDSATVDVVVLQTTAQSAQSPDNPTGCLSWTGSYDLIKDGDRWLIDQVHLSAAPC